MTYNSDLQRVAIIRAPTQAEYIAAIMLSDKPSRKAAKHAQALALRKFSFQ